MSFLHQYFSCLPYKESSYEFHSILKMISVSRRIFFENTRNVWLQYFRCLPLKISSSEFHSILKMISASRRIFFEKARNIRHWDRNSKISVFCHHGYVLVFKINNSGRNQKLKTYTIIWLCQKTI